MHHNTLASGILDIVQSTAGSSWFLSAANLMYDAQFHKSCPSSVEGGNLEAHERS